MVSTPHALVFTSRAFESGYGNTHCQSRSTHTKCTCYFHVRGDVSLWDCESIRYRRMKSRKIHIYGRRLYVRVSYAGCGNTQIHTNLSYNTDTCSYVFSICPSCLTFRITDGATSMMLNCEIQNHSWLRKISAHLMLASAWPL